MGYCLNKEGGACFLPGTVAVIVEWMCASQSKITIRIHGADTGGVEGYLVKTAVINEISALSSTWK